MGLRRLFAEEEIGDDLTPPAAGEGVMATVVVGHGCHREDGENGNAERNRYEHPLFGRELGFRLDPLTKLAFAVHCDLLLGN